MLSRRDKGVRKRNPLVHPEYRLDNDLYYWSDYFGNPDQDKHRRSVIVANLLETKDLEFYYPDGTQALKSINLQIESGQKIAVLGSNGAGKSTLFLHFNGILKPTKGKLFFKGNEVRHKTAELHELRKKVGIVFQDPDIQLFSANVYQEISFGPLNLKMTPDQVVQQVEQAMAVTGVSHLRNKPTHFLSYGQKKRVSIADVIAMEPEMIIFDEPTACLDPKHTQQILEFFNELHRQGTTILLSTHDVDTAYEWADQIIVMEDGMIVSLRIAGGDFYERGVA